MTPATIVLRNWIGCASFNRVQELYADFGKTEWLGILAAHFVAAVEQGHVYNQLEEPDQEFMAWAAMDLGARRPRLQRNVLFHARLEALLPRWRHWYLT